MPGVIRALRAASFTAMIFWSGGLPSITAVACERNSGSARKIAYMEKSGTKMQAKGIKTVVGRRSLVVGQKPLPKPPRIYADFHGLNQWKLSSVRIRVVRAFLPCTDSLRRKVCFH